MPTSTLIYTGNLRTEATHLESGTVILSDAPKDNQGNGAAFSPTDLVATALASCMLTTMGIVARREQIKMEGSKAEVTKVMYSEPRRIGEIHVKIDMSANTFNDKEKKLLENTAHACPVAKSLHPDVKQVISFVY
jgi:uncharacterized OsmC-like protein